MTRSASARIRPRFGRRGRESPLDVATVTGSLVAASPGAVWPFWLECQTDPASDSFVPLGGPPLARNLTHLDWTPVGTLAHGPVAHVDPRGLVVPSRGAGALDWWVRGPGGWILPSRCRPESVSQTLVEGTPVVRTRIAVAEGGSVTQTVFAAAGPGCAVVEFRNETDAPLAFALVLRPLDTGGIRRVRVAAVTPYGLEADGSEFATIADAPLAAACGRLGDGDLLDDLADVDTAGGRPARGAALCSCEDPGGAATAAAVVVVTHGRGLTAVLGGGGNEAAPSGPPESAAVVRGWKALRSTEPAVQPAVTGVSEAFAAQSGHLLALGRDRVLEPEIARALCALDHHGEVADALARLVGDARRSGAAFDAVAFLLTAGVLWRHTRDVEFFAGLEDELDRAVVAIGREVALVARRGAGAANGAVGPRLVTVAAAAGLASEIAAAAGPEAGTGDLAGAATATRAAAEEEADLRFAAEHDRICGDPGPALQWALARTWEPVVTPTDPRLVAAVAAAGEAQGASARRGGGADLRAIAALACVLAHTRSEDAWNLLTRLTDWARPTWTWPSLLNPRSGGGCGGDGADPVVAARFVSAIASCCVAATVDGLAVVPLAPPSTTLSAERLATAYGYLDVQMRRDGDDTVLGWRGLWGRRTPVLTAPGLDPVWSTSEPAGTVTF